MSEHIVEVEYDILNGTFSQKRREEVVRCRDCEHYTDDEMEYYHYCGSWCEQVTPDGYCAWGERRESE